ncbi:MAG: porin [Bacteroidetes bacterium]|nr:porin [Bacteroidota bacterium]
MYITEMISRILGFCLFWILSFSTILEGQEVQNPKKKGEVYGKIYSNFYTELNRGDNESAFEIRRAYFGYQHDLSDHFSANIKLDIGSPEDLSEFSLIRRYAYFKNAYLKYTHNNFSTYFGIIDLTHFKIQEKYWAHRYIEKSFADAYRFGFSADLGWMAVYEWTNWLSVDFTLSNGEGYTRLQGDNTFKTAFGVTILPGYNFITRLYYNVSEKGNRMNTTSAFIGYNLDHKLIAGIEYHYIINDNYVADQNRNGYSGYVSYYIFDKWQLFSRYDKVSSNIAQPEDIPWNLTEDGSKIIAGIEFSPIKEVKLAIDYQDWFPYAENIANEQYIFLNVEVSF